MKRVNVICGAVAPLLMASAVLAQGVPEKKVAFDLAAQPLPQALNAFAAQSNMRIVFEAQDAQGLVSERIRGKFSPQDALKILLGSSSLRYQFTDEHTVLIRRADATAGSEAVGDLNKTSWVRADGAPVHLAQADVPKAEVSSQEAASSSSDVPADTKGVPLSKIEQVVVTGTLIRGAAPTGSALKVYSREEIQQSGAVTLEQFARQMPENLSTVDSVSNARSSMNRAAFRGEGSDQYGASSFNLRGIGASSTLTLVNGHRVAPAGVSGAFVDASQIPLSAVERVEVMTDGASALYGADAVAGVVNIITRKDLRGLETGLRYSAATEGGAVSRGISQLLGGSWGEGSGMLNYDYTGEDGLDASDRDYLPDQGSSHVLLPRNRRNTILGSLRQQLGEKTTLSTELMYGDRKFGDEGANNSNFATIHQSSESDNRQHGATLAVDHDLSRDLHLNVTANYSALKQDGLSLTDVLAPSVSQQINNDLAKTSSAGLDLLMTGRLFSFGGRQAEGAIGIGYRRERYSVTRRLTIVAAGVSTAIDPTAVDESRNIKSVYGEFVIPVGANADISLAARHDRYADFGSATNPKIGVSWKALEGVELRATYGKSFRAPLISQLADLTPAIGYLSADNENIVQLQGGNGGLRSERSNSFTAGIEFKPYAIQGLDVGLSYYRIDFKNRIATPPQAAPGSPSLTDPLLQPFITLHPPLSLVNAYFNEPGFINYFGADPSDIVAIVDTRLNNIASVKQSGLDVSTRYSIPTARGTWSFSLDATRVLHDDYRTAEGADYLNLMNTFAQTPKMRGRGAVGWTQGNFTTTASVNYTNSYENNLFTTPQPIDAWTTLDLNLLYRFGETSPGKILKDVTVVFTVNNLTDKRPPYVAIPELFPGFIINTLPFDPANASAVGRVGSLLVTKKF